MLWHARYNPARVSAQLSASYFVKAAGLLALILTVVALRWRAHHALPRFGPANQITTLRAALVAAIAGLVGEPSSHVGIAIAAGTLATVLDGVDGWIARRTRMSGAFGARYDMEVDALLVLVLAIVAWQYGKAGVWILVSGLLRYLFIGATWVIPWMRGPLSPTLRARVICAVQFVTLLVCLLPFVDQPASSGIAAAGLVALTYSFAVDTMRLWHAR